MVIDSQTNFVYLADKLQLKFPEFYNNITAIFNKNNIKYDIIKGTNDIWCRDYMPVQLKKDKFIQFVYNPDYLQNERDKDKITNTDSVIENLNMKVLKTEILIDGGNIIKSKNTAILTDKVYKENNVSREEAKSLFDKKLKDLLEVEKIVILPSLASDTFSHTDGLIRFIDENTVLINEEVYGTKILQNKIKKLLRLNNLKYKLLPYFQTNELNKNGDYTAKGCYINYLHIGNFILLPVFENDKDKSALITMKECFPVCIIEAINCNEIAEDGGVLNCISWNIFK